jgi:hypothetical protein
MPIYDMACNKCGAEFVDVYFPAVTATMPCEKCGGECVHLWRPGYVVSDECDVWIRHGICNPDGTARHYRFKSEMRAEAKRRGLVNKVEHVGLPGSDKSPHTSKWY